MKVLSNDLIKYIDDVYTIHKQKLGESYLSKDYFVEQVNENKVMIAVDGEEVLGYLVFDLTTEKDFFESKNIWDYGTSIPVLCLLTIAVKRERQGVGTLLTQECINMYKDKVNKIYSPVWKSVNGTNADRLLTKNGFNIIKEIKNFWYEDSIGKKDYCPVCGSPCVCTMIIYGKESSVEK